MQVFINNVHTHKYVHKGYKSKRQMKVFLLEGTSGKCKWATEILVQLLFKNKTIASVDHRKV